MSTNKKGLRDWIVQRVTALVMTVYVLGLIGFLLTHDDVNYFTWQALFMHSWVKIATLIFFLSIMAHAWVGMWTIFTDYVKCPVARMVLNVVVFFALLGFSFAAFLILWGI